jgi:hypothetical protein
MTSLVLIPSSANFGIVAHEERLHRASLWAETALKFESPDASPVSPTGIIQLPAQVPTVPSPPISDTSIIQPTAQVPTVPSPPISEMPPIIQPTAQAPTVPSPPISDMSPIIQPMAQAPTVPSLPISDMSPIIQPTAQVPTVPTPNITSPNPPAPSLIPQTALDPSFALNPNQASLTLNSNFDANPQKSLSDLMSEARYTWPNQIQQGEQGFFHFPGFQDPSRMNNFDIDEESIFTPGLDVRLFF